MSDTITVKGERILLDALLVQRFGYVGQDMLARALELNHGIADFGSVLPLGTVITMPSNEDIQQFKPEPTITLFD